MCKKTAGLLLILYQHLASCKHVLCVLSFYPLISCTYYLPLLSHHPFLTSFPVLQQLLTPTPVFPPTHSRPAFSCCLPHNPWLCHPFPDIPPLSFSHSIFFYYGDRGRKFIQNSSKVIASFHIHSYIPFLISFNIVTFSVQILQLNELRNNKCHS